jgi:uncharacterized surface protein with fasciclin (FAS1) repeats
MRLVNSLARTVAAIAIAAASTAATAATGPFYNCIKKDLVQVDGTVVDAAVATPELSTLVSLVTSAGLGEALATTENITVFAPTNDAFAKIDPDVLAAIGGNADVLGAVLAYHVVPGQHDPRRWSSPVSRNTLGGAPVYLHHDGKRALVNSSKVNCTGVKTSNGTVWLVDSVLLPQF